MEREKIGGEFGKFEGHAGDLEKTLKNNNVGWLLELLWRSSHHWFLWGS